MLYANGYPVGGGGGGTGGHTIIDENGNSMTARAGLQFVGGANVSDDATNNKTIVDISGGGGGFGLVQSGHTVYTLTGQNLETRVPITFDTPFPEVPNVALSLSDPSRGQYYDPQTGLGVMNLTKNGFEIMIKSSNQAVAGDITIYWIATTKFSGNGIFHPTIYSFEERVIGVWTDGKPLYEKTFYKDNLATTFSDFVKFADMDNPETFVSIRWTAIRDLSIVGGSGILKYTGNGASYTEAQSTNYYILMRGSGNELQYRLGDNYGITEMWATVQYTKTTDVAGSGSWTPQGVPTHHYSTDEHIVGTWMGETLWEKTYDFSSTPISIPSGSNFMTSDIDSSNMGAVTNVFANHSDGTLYNDMSADPTGNNHTKLKLKSVGGATAYYLTLQYTKSS